MRNEIKAYKAMDKDMRCRGFQYEIGCEYEIDGDPSICENGFHSCENPFDTLNYYPRDSRFFEVIAGGDAVRDDDKICSAKIKITAEISFSDMFARFFASIVGMCLGSKEANTSGYRSHANTSGDESHANTSGDESHANTSGYRSHANTSGDESHANTSGDRSHANTSGKWSHASCSGINGKAMVDDEHGWLTVVNWVYNDDCCEWQINEICSACPGMEIHGVEIKTGVWYWFENGEFKSCLNGDTSE